MNLAALESQWVKWKQSWNFRSLKIAKSNCCIIYAHCQLSQQCALTVARLLDTLTEPSSLWSMSPLSSPCRMETAPGFSPWKLVIPHCGTPCLVFNFPINNFSQHLFHSGPWCPYLFCLRRSADPTKQFTTLPFSPWMRMTLLRTCYADWSHFR